MLPETRCRLQYEDYFLLDDNLGDSQNDNQDDENSPHLQSGGNNTPDYMNLEDEPLKLRFEVVLLCVEGCGMVRVNMQEIHFGASELLYIPQGVVIDKVHIMSSCRMAIIYMAYVNDDYLPKNSILLRLSAEMKNEPLLQPLRSESLRFFTDGYRLLRQAIADEYLTGRNDVVKGIIQALAASLLSEFDRVRQTGQIPCMPRSEQLFQQFLTLVRQHYAEHHEVSYYADRLCITPKYLGLVVRQVTGRRPVEWIRDHIILDARAMILSGNYTIQQVSDMLNFPNASFFGRYFREHVGCSPGQYGRRLS